MNTNCRLKEDLTTAERLLAAERARLAGVKDHTFQEFKQHMLEAIARGAAHNKAQPPRTNRK